VLQLAGGCSMSSCRATMGHSGSGSGPRQRRLNARSPKHIVSPPLPESLRLAFKRSAQCLDAVEAKEIRRVF
jgi:hypothetical protein